MMHLFNLQNIYNILLLKEEIETKPAKLLEAPRTTRKLPEVLSFDEIKKRVIN